MKGQWKTMEAVVSGIVMLMFVAGLFAAHSQTLSAPPVKGWDALSAVNDRGLLRGYAQSLDTAAIEREAGNTGYLSGYNYTVAICNATSCDGSAPSADQVFASSFIVAGDDSYAPAEVILYAYRG